MWEKKGDLIANTDDLIKAVKTLVGPEISNFDAFRMYPTHPKTSADPFVVVNTMSRMSGGEWMGRETTVTVYYSVDIFTEKLEKLEYFVKTVSDNLLSNNVRVVGRTDGRDRASTRWSAHLTVRASYDGYGRMFRGM